MDIINQFNAATIRDDDAPLIDRGRVDTVTMATEESTYLSPIPEAPATSADPCLCPASVKRKASEEAPSPAAAKRMKQDDDDSAEPEADTKVVKIERIPFPEKVRSPIRRARAASPFHCRDPC